MENITKDEEELILEALNHYWHYVNNELNRKDLGDIERKNLQGTKDKIRLIFNKFKLL